MHFTQALVFVCSASTVSAFNLPAFSFTDALLRRDVITNFSFAKRAFPVSISRRKGGNDNGNGGKGGGKGRGGPGACPAIWSTVSSDLTAMFLTNGQCNDDARAAIRAMFHDCGTWNKAQGDAGGCDGSLILAQEFNRPENNGLQTISGKLQTLAQQRGVGMADMIVFAASHAVVTCPLGPRVTTFVGRKDSANPAPDNLLPDVNGSGDSLFALFQDKGFDAVDLAALLGAHTSAKQSFVDTTQAGKSQDTTPGVWDVLYYQQTLTPPNDPNYFRFPSDINLANQASVGKEFQGFVNNQGKWNGKFADALTRMSLLGVPGGKNNLVDCTSALPQGTKKRDVKRAPINDRIR